MTHLCEVITLRPRRPNREALAHLEAARNLLEAAMGDINAGIVNATAGTPTRGLGGLSDGRTLAWVVQAAIDLVPVTDDPRDRGLQQVLQAWLELKATTHG